jgi:hypothetical protein
MDVEIPFIDFVQHLLNGGSLVIVMAPMLEGWLVATSNNDKLPVNETSRNLLKRLDKLAELERRKMQMVAAE